jgi:hypothetical protein
MPSRFFDLLFDIDDFVLVLFRILFVVVVASSSIISSRASSTSLSTSDEGFFRFSCCVR